MLGAGCFVAGARLHARSVGIVRRPAIARKCFPAGFCGYTSTVIGGNQVDTPRRRTLDCTPRAPNPIGHDRGPLNSSIIRFLGSAAPNPTSMSQNSSIVTQKGSSSSGGHAKRSYGKIHTARITTTKDNSKQKSKGRKPLPALIRHEVLEKATRDLLHRCQQAVIHIDNEPLKQQCLDTMEAWVAHAKANQDIKAAQYAETLLKTLEDELKIIPRLEYYDAIVRAYASCSDFGKEGSEEATMRADSVLRHTVQYTPHKVSARTYAPVYKAWGNSGSPNGGERCASLRELMIAKTGDRSWSMNYIRSETKAWSRSGHPKAPERILKLLLTTVKIWTEAQSQEPAATDADDSAESKVSPIAPTEAMFHTAMQALWESAALYKQRSARQVAHQLDSIAKLMIERHTEWQISPSLRTFTIVLSAWERVAQEEKNGDAAQRAQTLLEYIIESATRINQVEQRQENGPGETAERIMPINNSFVIVMRAWCAADQPDKAEALFHRLVKLYQSTKDPKLLPATNVAAPFLARWARLGKPDKVMESMKMMQRVAMSTRHPACQLDMHTFTILLNALAKAEKPDDALTLLDWLQNHNEKYAFYLRDGNKDDKYAALFNPLAIKRLEPPSEVAYCCVLEVLGKCDRVRKAEELLSLMESRGIRISQVAYTSVMLGYVHMGHDPNNVARAYEIFQKVCATQKPDIVCATVFINVCSSAQPVERELALKLALETYKALGPSVRNDRVYKAMLTVINRLAVRHETDPASNTMTSSPAETVSEHINMISKVTRDCCDAGHFSRRIQQLVGFGQVTAIMGKARLDPSWSRKIPPEHKPHDENPDD